MPSPTVSTVPTSATFASASKPAICCFRISEISAGRMSISGCPSHGVLQSLQLGLDAVVVEPRADPHDQAAEDRGIHLLRDPDAGEPGLRQARRDLGALRVRQRVRAGHHRGLLARSEEHTSELQSRQYLVCRLLLEKKNI